MNIKATIKALTYSGLLPFIVTAIMIVFGYDFSSIFITYGAIILSFMSGVHWGQAVSGTNKFNNFLLLSSNIIALAAWLSLLTTELLISLAILFLGFLVQLAIDIKIKKLGIIENWYLSLRKVTTTILLAVIFVVFLFLIFF